MKKQILILIVAIFVVGLSNAFGQGAITVSPPQPLIGCTPGPMNPIAGVPYNYATIVNPAGGNFQWWATKSPNFIQTVGNVTTNNIATRLLVPTDLIAASASYGVTSPTDNVTITWSGATLAATTPANPTFVAVQYDAPGAVCANNFKVFKISPIFAFTVDIKNVEDATLVPLAYNAAESQCVSKVTSAVFNPSILPDGAMEMDYGKDTLYFEVVAANFTDYWVPSFHLDGLLGQQAATLDWSYSPTFLPLAYSYPSQAGGGTVTFYNAANHALVDPSVTNTNLGVSIFVRVIVSNQRYETLAGQTFTLSVEGTNAEGTPDIDNATCLPPVPATGYEDLAAQLVNPRPTVTPVAPGVFVPQAP